MNDKATKIAELETNWDYVQARIELIKVMRNIDIRHISDLQRYVEMQLNIMKTIMMIEDSA